MDVLTATKNGLIRFARGRTFDASEPAGYRLNTQWLSLDEAIRQAGAKYAGSVFVAFGADLPAEVPLDCPEHTWAEQVVSDDRPIGALVTWSTEEIEQAHRDACDAAEIERANHFHGARGAGLP